MSGTTVVFDQTQNMSVEDIQMEPLMDQYLSQDHFQETEPDRPQSQSPASPVAAAIPPAPNFSYDTPILTDTSSLTPESEPEPRDSSMLRSQSHLDEGSDTIVEDSSNPEGLPKTCFDYTFGPPPHFLRPVSSPFTYKPTQGQGKDHKRGVSRANIVSKSKYNLDKIRLVIDTCEPPFRQFAHHL